MKSTHLPFFLLIFSFSFLQLSAQHDSLFYKAHFGVKIGGTYTFTNNMENGFTQEASFQTAHEIGIPENDYGFTFGIFGLFKLSDNLRFQAEMDLVSVRSIFDYDTYRTEAESGNFENQEGVYNQKELYLQIPVMLKYVAGKEWKFAFGAGLFYRGSAFSNSNWVYDKSANYDFDNEVPRDPNNILMDLDDQIQFFKNNNLGVIADIGVIRPITRRHNLFLEFRYAHPFLKENDIPAFSQQTMSVNIGMMMKILKDKEEADKKKKKRVGSGKFDF